MPAPSLRRRVFFLIPVLLVAAACGEDAPTDAVPPQETVLLQAVLRSPTRIDGAALVEMSADEILGIRTDGQEVRLFAREDQGRLQAALVRLIPGQITFEVLARSDVLQPRIEVLQVADLDNELVEDLTEYRVVVHR